MVRLCLAAVLLASTGAAAAQEAQPTPVAATAASAPAPAQKRVCRHKRDPETRMMKQVCSVQRVADTRPTAPAASKPAADAPHTTEHAANADPVR